MIHFRAHNVKSLDVILKEYIASSTELNAGRLQRRAVPNKPLSEAELEIKTNLPAILSAEIERSGRQANDYRVYGSVGQTNFPFARIPWVAALHREVSTSTERGYYIVLLFREDMSGCVLSLNQGFTQFLNAFGTPSLATRKVRESAAIALTYLDVPSEFIQGPIDLGAKGNLGIGYEQGAIVSRAYLATEEIGANEFLTDFSQLLGAYDTLRQRLGRSILDAVSAAAEDEFQEAATVLSKGRSKRRHVPPPPGPVPAPPRSPRAMGSGYKRDPLIAAAAISAAEYLCELSLSHVSFIARTTKQNYVEAHHLIPIQFQEHFSAKLDVLENVVVLCPTCHRKLHHGLFKEKTVVLEQLLAKHGAELKSRGLEIGPMQLFECYRSELEEE